MIKYKKYQNKNDKSAAYNKWYGRAVHELMEFDEFIEHMAGHHCAFSEGTIKGVLIEMEVCLRELLLEGKAVRIDDLGIFTIGLQTDGAVSADKFTAQNIKAVGVNLFLGKRFRARNLFEEAKFKEVDKYVGDGNYYEPEDGSEVAGGTSETPSQGGNNQTGGQTTGGNQGGNNNPGSNTGGGDEG